MEPLNRTRMASRYRGQWVALKTDRKTVVASGKTMPGYLHAVTLEVGGNRVHRVPIAFSREMPDNAVNILGQRGFFELFPIKFTYAKKEIEIMSGSRAAS